MALLIPLLLLILLGLAVRYASDSRDGRDWVAGPPAPRRNGDIVLH